MGRLRTIGFEIGIANAGSSQSPYYLDGGLTSGSGTIDTSVFRSGLQSIRNSLVILKLTTAEQVLGRRYYIRVYVRVSAYPSAADEMVELRTGGGTLIGSAKITTAGNVQLFGPSAQIGSDSTSAIQINTWHRLEIMVRISTGSADELELLLDGTTVATQTGASYTDTTFGVFNFMTIAGAPTPNIWFDDVAINDDQGASQNTYPGAGNIVLLEPVSDNARGANWFDGGGGTTSLFEATNNTPPTGSGTPTAGTQVKNAAKDTTGNYDANLTSYTTAGVPSTATITLVQPVFSVGATKSVTGAEQFVSNPAGPAESSIDCFEGVAAGTWPVGWRSDWLAAIVGDITSGNRGTSPVIRIGKRQSSTNAAYCAFMAAYVEYVEAAGGDSPFPYLGGGYFP